MVEIVCGFDIAADGAARALESGDLTPDPNDGAAYRWIHFDVATPGFKEWARRSLPSIAAATLAQSETRPRCEAVEEGVALNLRGVNFNPDGRAEDMVSLRIWATEKFVITCRLRRIMTIDEIRKEIEQGRVPHSPGQLIRRIADGLIDRLEAHAIDLEDRTDSLEEQSFSDQSVATSDIAALRRAVIMIRRFATPQKEALSRLAAVEGPILGRTDRAALRETANRATRTAEALEALRERLAVLQDQSDARTAAWMGRTSYVLSVVAAIFLPLGFLTGLFGVNVAGMPGMETGWAFAALSAAMIIIGAALVLYFRWRRWF